jgi:general secretion pathway protein H
MGKGLNQLQAQQNIISERVEMLFAEHEDAAILRTSEPGLKLGHHHGGGQVDRLLDVSNERPRLASAVPTDVNTNALAARSGISHTSVTTLPLPILPALQIARELAKAQKEAVLSKRPQTFMVDVERRVVGMDSGHYFFQFDPVIKLSLETASSEVINEHSGRIRFLPDGSSTGGRIHLQHARIGARIDIDWSTGAVNVQVFGDWSSSSD